MNKAWYVSAILLYFLSFIIISQPSIILGDNNEAEYHQRVIELKENINSEWTMDRVEELMGPPDIIKQVDKDTEIWGYRGFEVRIEFRNGLADKWFFRFMR